MPTVQEIFPTFGEWESERKKQLDLDTFLQTLPEDWSKYLARDLLESYLKARPVDGPENIRSYILREKEKAAFLEAQKKKELSINYIQGHRKPA